MARQKQGKTVTLAGTGNLAHALAELLPGAGYTITELVARSRSPRARKLSRKIGVPVTTIPRAAWSGKIVWLAVSDSAIAELASTLAAAVSWEGKLVFHSSGALGSGELDALRRRGARVASVHPMMTFVPGKPPEMAGVIWTVEGDEDAVRAARRMVEAMTGRALTIDAKQKALYHAFGAFLSPLLVVHLQTAAELAMKVGIPRRDLASLMRPILMRTLFNLLDQVGKKGGAGKAFSGPLIRGDVGTIQRHLKALSGSPSARSIYKALVSAAVQSELPVKNREQIAKVVRRTK